MEITHLSESVTVKRINEDGAKGIFEIEGLYRGYGVTVGSSLRRILLSSIPGAAITRFKVKGVSHEFDTIPGVMEDVLQIALNLKKIRFKFHAHEPQVLTLKAKGEGEVTAGDVSGNAEVEVQNKDLHIATLTTKGAELDMELTVEKGLGYRPIGSGEDEKLPVGVIAIDAVFSPVTNVSFEVETTRVGERADYNKVILAIETDGTLSPSQVLHKASEILLDHFQKIADLDVLEAKGAEITAKKKTKSK
ncbi:MAG TPA: DNA-directed RNA polymerase subunit alpha [Candidatus Tyrphobacter sp.]|nr:DNA-directed RNA polymerase subunit alpha [Candidatus Tyrphobacter sp.]